MVMAYVVMADRDVGMDYVVMAYAVMAYVVMACVVMAYVVMEYVVMKQEGAVDHRVAEVCDVMLV